ncbi:MAG: hypothetical protein ACOY3K_02195 [Candidatus Omnitrophota bacterium]
MSEESLRGEIQQAAKVHKASWIRLGQYLGAVYKDKMYRHWGYLSFEAYCVKELGIKQQTAQKMLRSYAFLETEEPKTIRDQTLEEETPAQVPHVDSVNLLRLAKNNTHIEKADLEMLREKVIEEAREPAEVRQHMRSVLEKAKAAEEGIGTRDLKRRAAIKRLISSLKASETLLRSEKLVPSYLLTQIDELVKKLEDQISDK